MFVALYTAILVYHFPLVSREPDDLKAFAPPASTNVTRLTGGRVSADEVLDPEFGGKAKFA